MLTQARACHPPSEPRTILIIQLDHMGDAVLSTGMISVLRRRWPRASIEILVGRWNRDLLAATDALRQVILNLALNAVDATPAQGRVRMLASSGAGLEVRVEDQGPGVSLELRQHVFEPFFTTRAARPGGLGLPISRRLVESAGGTLDVVDAEGGGAAFRLRFEAT